ncbi:DUF11 domain-containing protein [Paenibacillus polymyxa]|nr:DUF11 domain-containing protein [Paenibacillus polymyxa]
MSTDHKEALAGETLTYTVLLNNFGNITSEVILQNFIPAGTLYIPQPPVERSIVCGSQPCCRS